MVKEAGIPAKSSVDKVFTVQLPANDFSNFTPDTMWAERNGASFSGNFWFVEYSLNVFVKHDSWNEFGEGASVTFPIRIHQAPVHGPYLRSIEENVSLPDNWQPKKGLKKKVTCEGVATDMDYYHKVVERSEKKWQAKMMPHVMTDAEVKEQESGSERDKTVKEVAAEFEERMRSNTIK